MNDESGQPLALAALLSARLTRKLMRRGRRMGCSWKWTLLPPFMAKLPAGGWRGLGFFLFPKFPTIPTIQAAFLFPENSNQAVTCRMSHWCSNVLHEVFWQQQCSDVPMRRCSERSAARFPCSILMRHGSGKPGMVRHELLGRGYKLELSSHRVGT
eukprot:1141507-Pelagomonas_calceolata.AAC.6